MGLFAVKAAVGLGLLLALGLAVAARAPRRAPTPGALRLLLAGGAALYGAAIAAFVAGQAGLAEAACALGVLAAALAGWLSRGGADDDDGPAAGDPPVDWDGFERARRGWERPRTPSG